jgi:putative transposase
MHLNSQKRFYLENALYFITTKTKDNVPIFNNKMASEYLIVVIRFAQSAKNCTVYGYVILPDHLHIIIQPRGKHTISDFMHYVKRHSSRNLRILISHNIVGEDGCLKNNGLFPYVGEDGHPRLRSGGVWQSSFHDHIIRDERDFLTHLEYLKHNPVKHGALKDGKTYAFTYIDDSAVGKLIR